MDLTTLIGLIAGACTTMAALPQIVQSWKTKQVNNVSLGMFLVLFVGVSLWCVYGIIKKDIPIILTNGLSVILNLIMLYLIVTYSKKKMEF